MTVPAPLSLLTPLAVPAGVQPIMMRLRAVRTSADGYGRQWTDRAVTGVVSLGVIHALQASGRRSGPCRAHVACG
ncbi:hypothetical protein FRAHR75_350029 [Frankia sp. Hr75.2]|nr:hypothetical protein FRAHR75_350029 [Frankia sp. Hr75.2]SQD93753.1 hypothetical protein FMEAI12_1860001 [Parafrankia sp. Ea1.12]